jgi:hypothetical protein
VDDLVVHLDDIGVAHRRDARTHDDARAIDGRVASLAGCSHLIDQTVGRPLARIFLLLERKNIVETPRSGKKRAVRFLRLASCRPAG